MRKKTLAWGILMACEAISAAVYAKWLAPRLASQHLDLETACPLFLMVVLFTASIVVFIYSTAKKKAVVNALMASVSLLLWSILLYEIGLHTECPVCASPLF